VAKTGRLRDKTEELIDIAAGGCKQRVEAIRLYRRNGIADAIRYLRIVPGTNVQTLELLVNIDETLRNS
jgi:hypothetical protein